MRTAATGRVIPVRLPLEQQTALDLHLSATGKSQTDAMREAVQLLLAGCRIPAYKPRDPHTKGCSKVYRLLAMYPKHGLTSQEIAYPLNDAANNIAARLKDLHVAGYVERTGEQRRGKKHMLDVWRCVPGVPYLGEVKP